MTTFTTTTFAPGQVDCSTITNITDCFARPNATWNSTTGVCHCCTSDGSYYVSGGSGPNNPAVCIECKGKCGNPKFCKGTIVNANAVCVENTTTAEWTAVCRNNATCGGECNGACGWSEWFAFSQCNIADGAYRCTVSFSQYKSWIFYIALIIFILLIAIVSQTSANYIKRTAIRSNRILARGALLGLVTYWVHGVLNYFLDTEKASVPFWGFIAILVALQIYDTSVREKTDTQ